ncbi:beta-soluble NSF attachment protein [Egretta garzetta]|uniref:beta-soluble NSF attachment protein n=1 Tax=Egretta garzetta TaxID=188379 RepID=UPI00163B93F9|nr:beta-soluble NSF attachment protein [Egretta garzetta]
MQLQSKHDSATSFVDAGNAYKKADPQVLGVPLGSRHRLGLPRGPARVGESSPGDPWRFGSTEAFAELGTALPWGNPAPSGCPSAERQHGGVGRDAQPRSVRAALLSDAFYGGEALSRCPCERLLSLSPALNLHWTSGALNKSRGKFPRAASCFERGCASLHPAARRNGKACASVVAAGWPERKPYLRSGVQARCFCPQAIAHYEQAADYYKGEESNSSANKCLLKVAAYAAQLEQYQKAIEIYEQVGTNTMDNPLLKYSAKEYFFKAALCHFIVDELNAKLALEKYEEMFPAFTDSRECKLLKKLLEAHEEQNSEAYTEAVKEFDSISRLDQWLTTMLLRIKKSIQGEGDGDLK